MASEQRDWEEKAVARYRQQLAKIKEELGEHASIAEIERVLMEHERSLMSETLDALAEGVSPPRDERDS